MESQESLTTDIRTPEDSSSCASHLQVLVFPCLIEAHCWWEIVFSWVLPDLMLVGLFQLFVGKGGPTSFAQILLIKSLFSYAGTTW